MSGYDDDGIGGDLPEVLALNDEIARLRRRRGGGMPAPGGGHGGVFPTMTLAEVMALPPPEWLIEGVLTTDAVAVLYGPPASLKSFVALDMSLSIAFARPWNARPVKSGCGVLYIAGEGMRGFGKRVRAWQVHHGLDDGTAPLRVLGTPVNLTNEEQAERLIRTAAAVAKAETVPIGLVVVDTLARAMTGAEENSAKDMGLAVHAVEELRRATGGAVLLVHHGGKDEERGTRGSNALPAAVEAEIKVKRDGRSLTLTIIKQKDGEEGPPIALAAEKVVLEEEGDDRPEVSSLVIVPGDAASAALAASGQGRGLPQQARIAYRILCDAIAQSGETDHAGAPAGVPSIPASWWRERFYDRGMADATPEAKQKAFARASSVLVEAQRIGLHRGRVWLAARIGPDGGRT